MRIAIIEDNERDSEQYREILEAAWDGVEVVQLFNESQAQVMLQRISSGAVEPFDVITLDIDLSEGDPGAPDKIGGYRILGQLSGKSGAARSTVIVVSGALKSPDLVHLIEASQLAVDTLAKPHTLADYLRSVRLGYQVHKGQTVPAVLTGSQLKIGDLVLDPLNGPPKWRGSVVQGCKTLTHQRLIAALAQSPTPLSIDRLKRHLTALNPSPEAVVVQISSIRKAFAEVGGTKDYPIATRSGAYVWVHDPEDATK
jgi:DNA-binding response OmpR family regulator